MPRAVTGQYNFVFEDYRGATVFLKAPLSGGISDDGMPDVEIKLRFLISPAYCGRGVRLFFWDQPF